MERTLYLLLANLFSGILGFCLYKKDKILSFDRPTQAIVLWSLCYCIEYGLFLVFPGSISLSQLIVCQCLAPLLAVYLSQDEKRTMLNRSHKIFSIAPLVFLLGVAYFERSPSGEASSNVAWILLTIVFLSVVVSQACARFVARNRTPSWSQPRLTISNAVLLTAVLFFALKKTHTSMNYSPNLLFSFSLGVVILLIQRFYIFGLKKADPFISAMTLCTIVPLSLATEFIFEHRSIQRAEILLAAGYVLSTAINVKLTKTKPLTGDLESP